MCCLRHKDESQNGLDLFAFRDGSKHQIDVQIRWNSATRLTYETYKDELKRIVVPILKAFNIESKNNLKLSVTSKSDMFYEIPPRAREFFYYFVQNANKTNLHEHDWVRFHRFVRVVPKALTDDRLRDLLIEAEFSMDQTEEILHAYYQLRLFKRPKTAAEIHQLQSLRN